MVRFNEIKYKPNPNESKYLNFDVAKAFKKPINLVVGARSIGKTLGTKKDIVIKNWFETGYKTLYLRRFITQIEEELSEDWFGEALQLYCKENGLNYEDYEQGQDGRNITINGETIATLAALTEAVNLKGSQRLGYNNIVLDEFIEKENRNYIPPAVKEPTDYLMKMVITFFRDSNIPVDKRWIWLLSNSEKLANPYFIAFDMVDKVKEDTEFLYNSEYLLWLPRMSEELYQEMLSDPIKRAIMQTEYGGVAFRNEFFDAKPTNIEPRLFPNSEYMFGVKLYGQWVNIYLQTDKKKRKGYWYCTTKGKKNKDRYVLNAKEIDEDNEVVIMQDLRQEIRLNLNMNGVQFDSLRTKSLFTEVFA